VSGRSDQSSVNVSVRINEPSLVGSPQVSFIEVQPGIYEENDCNKLEPCLAGSSAFIAGISK